MSTTRLGGPGRRRDEALTERIVARTLAMLVEHGYEAMTVEAIARAADVSRSTIYKRWPTLADLLLDATLAARTAASAFDGNHELGPPDTGSLRGDLQGLVAQGEEILAVLERGGLLRGLIGDAIRHPAIAERLRTELLERDEQQYRSIFERAVERGEIPVDLERAALVPEVLLSLGLHRRLLRGQPAGPEVFDAMIDLLLDGLVSGPSTAPTNPRQKS